ncbi:hypothetical protein BJV77DRAFT_980510 [Russula vinacea]|nr:hypothetical protein BJV77DRAFT_980510 [Russula vinacea]
MTGTELVLLSCPAVLTAQQGQYLSLASDQFKINMSHIVKDLAMLAGGASASSDWNASGDEFADWVYDIYRGRQENVRCVMGYIVNLIVILDEMFGTAASNVTEDVALMVMESIIHEDIRRFVTETFSNRFYSDNDLVLEKIIDLIRHYCSRPQGIADNATWRRSRMHQHFATWPE